MLFHKDFGSVGFGRVPEGSGGFVQVLMQLACDEVGRLRPARLRFLHLQKKISLQLPKTNVYWQHAS